MSNLAVIQQDFSQIEQVLVAGDLAKLSPQQRVAYYDRLCGSLGLNPLTKPFEYLQLSGKLVLYARRDCTDQLRKIHHVSIRVVSRDVSEEMVIVTTQATTPNGRTDESIGAVTISGLKGEALANALMKADTKAKRRVTLSICGLGMLDESEIDGVGEPALPRVTPHDDGDDPHTDDGTFAKLTELMAHADDLNAEVGESFERACELRAYLGSAAKQSELTKAIQAAKEARLITPDQHKELSKNWQRLNRACAKLEAELDPGSLGEHLEEKKS